MVKLKTKLISRRTLICCALLAVIGLLPINVLRAEHVENITFFGASGKYSFKNDVFLQMLELSLSKTQPEFGGYSVSQVDMDLKQGRAVEEMHMYCPFDLIWLVSTDKREKNLLPIKVPLLKGLFGLRVPMIHMEDKQKFSQINSSSQLQKMTAGQGHDWPDTKVLQHNNYNVLPVANYRALFNMLSEKKIDYFPRSVAEIADELKLAGNEDLISQPTILMHYPSPIYFFVCRNKHALAARIQKGLEIAIDDGSFEAAFKSSREYQAFIALGGLQSKQVYDLANPELDMNALPANQNYWIVKR